MEKHDACAAAISSSGLSCRRRRRPPSARPSSPAAPDRLLVVERIVRLRHQAPCQVTSARRSVAHRSPLSVADRGQPTEVTDLLSRTWPVSDTNGVASAGRPPRARTCPHATRPGVRHGAHRSVTDSALAVQAEYFDELGGGRCAPRGRAPRGRARIETSSWSRSGSRVVSRWARAPARACRRGRSSDARRRNLHRAVREPAITGSSRIRVAPARTTSGPAEEGEHGHGVSLSPRAGRWCRSAADERVPLDDLRSSSSSPRTR